MHFNEYIQPGQAPTGQVGAQSVRHTQIQAQKGLTQAGFAGGKDIRKGNMIYDAAAGQHRVIDYIPARQGEFQRLPKSMANRLSVSPESASPFNPNYNPQDNTSTGGMLGRLLGGRSQSGGIRESVGSLSNAATQPVPSMGQTVAGAGKARGMARGTPAQPTIPRPTSLATAKTVPSHTPTAPLTPTSSSSPTTVLKPPSTTPIGNSAPATAVTKPRRPTI